MNLDDFIVADSLAPPTGISNSPSPDLATQSKNKPLRSQINAIPINPHKPRQASLPHFGPQSVPVPPHAPNAQREFGYITRHHRKTSIDERRVSLTPCWVRHKMATISWLFSVLSRTMWRLILSFYADSETPCRFLTPCLWHCW